MSVLWILAILTVITFGFGRRTLLDLRAATFSFDHAKAMYMARGAVERGIIELRNKTVIDQLYQQPGRTSFAQRWANPVDMLQEKAYFKDEGEEFKDEICQFKIRDEESLISINSADEQMLRNIKSLPLAVIRKIMKRRSGDLDSDEPPQAFQTIEEVRELEGIRDKHWFGNGKAPGLSELLTCWGTGQINVNTASADVLRCIPDLSESVIGAIMAYRAGPDGELGTSDDQDFATLEEVASKAGIAGESIVPLRQYCKTNSQFFTIRGVATRRQGKIRATCVATVSINFAGGDNEAAGAGILKWQEDFLDS